MGLNPSKNLGEKLWSKLGRGELSRVGVYVDNFTLAYSHIRVDACMYVDI